jgi:uncharacterized protein (TIGR02118 family)
MVKLVYCLRRKPGLSLEEFSRYWHEVHGPIGRRIPGLLRLVQSHAIADPDNKQPGYDGMAELWFDNVAALRAARRSSAWQTSTSDEQNFVDTAHTALFLTVEREIPHESS